MALPSTLYSSVVDHSFDGVIMYFMFIIVNRYKNSFTKRVSRSIERTMMKGFPRTFGKPYFDCKTFWKQRNLYYIQKNNNIYKINKLLRFPYSLIKIGYRKGISLKGALPNLTYLNFRIKNNERRIL